MHSPRWYRFSFLALVLALGAGCERRPAAGAPEQSAPPRKVVLQTDWFPQAEHGGYYQALARGFYAEAGLQVDIWPGGPGAGIKLKVARGDADFGLMKSDDLLLAARAGMPFIMVAASMQHDPQAIMVHEQSPVRRFEDLDGRVVIGNVGLPYFAFLEKKYGITIQRRQNTYGLGEFLGDPTLIQQCLVTSEPFFARQHGRTVRTLTLASAGYDPYPGLVTRRDLVRTSPDLIRAFVHASIRGWRDYLEHDPAPADELILKKNTQMTPELLAFSRGELIAHRFVQGDAAHQEDIGRISMARIQAEIDRLVRLKIMDAPIEISAVATVEFLPAPSH